MATMFGAVMATVHLPRPNGHFQTRITNVVADGFASPRCDGGLTHNLEVSDWLGAKYLPIHVHCGGAPILSLRLGDTVTITDIGVFKVADFRSIPFGNIPATALSGLTGRRSFRLLIGTHPRCER